ncbi:hypothetical protein LIER_42222 [Lithospermum erythrorhizon]|uniref:Uncharacterized protein n=1 Tax=Lithospermum erythrorhizon TaxID=34254 RepID=A0AAV3RM69_LITER
MKCFDCYPICHLILALTSMGIVNRNSSTPPSKQEDAIPNIPGSDMSKEHLVKITLDCSTNTIHKVCSTLLVKCLAKYHIEGVQSIQIFGKNQNVALGENFHLT